MSNFENLSPRDFEVLVAQILASFGWQVSLTPPERDGGVDVIGITKDPSGLETTWAVECKRYGQDREAGVNLVRQLYATRVALGFDKAVLVTTTGFTSDARQFAERAHGLHLVDHKGLKEWLQRSPIGKLPSQPIQTPPKAFASCFISHSSLNKDFTGLLVERLRNAGVRVWYGPEQMNPGEKIVDQVDAAINTFDRLIVVLSKASLTSNWVTTEVRKAFARQKRENRQILFPVSLIPYEELRKWEWIDPDTGEDLALEIRSYFIPDFSDWQTPARFDEQFTRLLNGLYTTVTE
jgi:hypothetical protein